MENYSDFKEVLDDFVDIGQRIEAIRQKLTDGDIPYASQDARQVALDGLQCDIGSCGRWIHTLIGLKQLCRDSFGDEWEHQYLTRIGVGLEIGEAEDLMLNYLRNTVVTKVHFKIENLFTNILRTLHVSSRTGFWNISNAMLEQASICTNGREKQLLSALANLRNSHHSNGIHNNYDLAIEVEGVRFEFHRGKRVECASWFHIVTLIRNTLPVVELILFSSVVKAIKVKIVDQFSESTI